MSYTQFNPHNYIQKIDILNWNLEDIETFQMLASPVVMISGILISAHSAG